jgi:hypothetical protein
VLIVDVDAKAGTAFADVLQAGVARVAVLALLLAWSLPLCTLVDVHALLAVRAQPQARPVAAQSIAAHHTFQQQPSSLSHS